MLYLAARGSLHTATGPKDTLEMGLSVNGLPPSAGVLIRPSLFSPAQTDLGLKVLPLDCGGPELGSELVPN